MCGGVGSFIANSTGLPQLKAAAKGDFTGVVGTAIGLQAFPKSVSKNMLGEQFDSRPKPAAPIPVSPAKASEDTRRRTLLSVQNSAERPQASLLGA